MKQNRVLEKHRSGISKRARLHVKMTLSYVIITTAIALIGELLMMALLFLFLTHFALAGGDQRTHATDVAGWYALQASVQANGSRLNPQTFFSPNSPGVPAPPGDIEQFVTDRSMGVVLLIAPDGQILASSSPSRYPVATTAAHLLPGSAALITGALSGKPQNPVIEATPQGHVVSIAQTVWSRQRHPIGAIYVQASLDLPASPLLSGFAQLWIRSALLFLLLILPIGVIFGMLSTRGLVQRIKRLVTATAQFASGQYTQRVPVSSQDEIGQLEGQFNQMAEQLVESMQSRQKLTEQNARMTERARISRELHDAISQDLFSLRMLTGGLQTALPADSPLQPQIATLKQTTTTMIREMRALLLELRPTQLERQGLAEALEDLAAAYRTRLGISVTTSITAVALPSQMEHTLLRITQEALSNAARHADATAITLALIPQKVMITLTITDNGTGFAQEANATQHGLGLRLMQERVQELNGTFELQTAPGQGTRIQVALPQEKGHGSHCNS